MKTRKISPLFAQLATIAPSIAFSVHYEKDPSFRWDGDGPDPRDEGFEAYDVFVAAKTVCNGELIDGEAGMGGTYEKPGEFDEDIGGYLPQMLQEAIEDLFSQVPGENTDQHVQLNSANAFIRRIMQERYDAQMAAK